MNHRNDNYEDPTAACLAFIAFGLLFTALFMSFYMSAKGIPIQSRENRRAHLQAAATAAAEKRADEAEAELVARLATERITERNAANRDAAVQKQIDIILSKQR